MSTEDASIPIGSAMVRIDVDLDYLEEQLAGSAGMQRCLSCLVNELELPTYDELHTYDFDQDEDAPSTVIDMAAWKDRHA